MKNLFSTYRVTPPSIKFVFKDAPSYTPDLTNTPEWAKEQLKKQTADSLGNLMESVLQDKDLSKKEIVSLLSVPEAQNAWSKNQQTPTNSARYTMALQAGLKALGHDAGKIDAMFGSGTRNAVISFQKKHKLAVDGAPGPQTIGKMLELLKSNTSKSKETNDVPEELKKNMKNLLDDFKKQKNVEFEDDDWVNLGELNGKTRLEINRNWQWYDDVYIQPGEKKYGFTPEEAFKILSQNKDYIMGKKETINTGTISTILPQKKSKNEVIKTTNNEVVEIKNKNILNLAKDLGFEISTIKEAGKTTELRPTTKYYIGGKKLSLNTSLSHTPGSTDESWKISDENSNVIRFENQQEAVNAFKNAYLKESFKRDIEIGNFNFNGVFSGETSSREDFIKETIIIVNNSNTKIGLINMYNFLNKLDPNKNINYGLYRGSNPRSGGRSKEQTEKENKELLDEFKTYIKKL